MDLETRSSWREAKWAELQKVRFRIQLCAWLSAESWKRYGRKPDTCYKKGTANTLRSQNLKEPSVNGGIGYVTRQRQVVGSPNASNLEPSR